MRKVRADQRKPRHSASRTCDRIGQKTPWLQPNSRNVPAPVPSEVASPAKRTHVSSAQFSPANLASHAHSGETTDDCGGRAQIPVRPSSDPSLPLHFPRLVHSKLRATRNSKMQGLWRTRKHAHPRTHRGPCMKVARKRLSLQMSRPALLPMPQTLLLRCY